MPLPTVVNVSHGSVGMRMSQDKAVIRRLPQLGDLELLRAHYRRHTFGRHFHDGYAIGVVEGGALGFSYLGKNHVAAPGDVNLAVPGECHNGFAASEDGWRYRMFYLPPDLLEQAASEISDRSVRPPFFRQGVIHDPSLASRIQSTHMALDSPETSLLEAESRLLDVLTMMILRHAENRLTLGFRSCSHRAVARAVDYLQAHYDENPSLERLSEIAGLSRFHFLRVFSRRMGLPPHAYLTQLRVGRAKDLIGRGNAIADVALETGFSDQSHLNRHFKRIVGVTPGTYSNSVQD